MRVVLSCEDYRQLEIETRNLPNTNGSSRCRIGKTEVLVVFLKFCFFKAEVVDVDCSATALLCHNLPGRGVNKSNKKLYQFQSSFIHL